MLLNDECPIPTSRHGELFFIHRRSRHQIDYFCGSSPSIPIEPYVPAPAVEDRDNPIPFRRHRSGKGNNSTAIIRGIPLKNPAAQNRILVPEFRHLPVKHEHVRIDFNWTRHTRQGEGMSAFGLIYEVRPKHRLASAYHVSSSAALTAVLTKNIRTVKPALIVDFFLGLIVLIGLNVNQASPADEGLLFIRR